MPPKVEKQQAPVDVVEIGSSDDEDSVAAAPAPIVKTSSFSNPKTQPPKKPLPPPQPQQLQIQNPPPTATTIAPAAETLDSRSFWKAGNYDVGPALAKATVQGELEHARVHPKFLHSNATSHKWAFGAIAELLDNAVDEIQKGATFVKIDKIDIMNDNSPALLFQDDGGGMNPDALRKCMSLGYSSKKSKTTIGQYGNGFKTSTMRLGADVIVFSRATHASKATQSVGLLSYTFLRKTGQNDVIVPMIDFDISGNWAEPIIYSSQDDWSSNLKSILEWSPVTSKDMLLQQFEDIGPHGTKIVIFNLWLNDEGIYELSFDDDEEDIRLRDETLRGQTKLRKKTVELQCHISYRLRYSLRAYASILYLRKFDNFNIILRGKPVEQFNIADDLKHSKTVTYRPQMAMGSQDIVETTIGFIKEAPTLTVCGFNVYHKNRLIRPFWKVIGDGSAKGNGVVGVLEANFIEPAHDKQDFERSSLFIRLEARLKQILNEYWKHHCHLTGHFSPMQRGQAKMQTQPTANQHMDPPITGLPATVQQYTSNGHGSVVNLPTQQPVLAAESCDELISEDGLGSMSVDELCEQNIELFMRREECKQKETELKQMVEELEKELEQSKRKCAQLSAHLESKRKQMLTK